MAVCVGLPLTTKVPLSAAMALAAARPRMSASSSRVSRLRDANARNLTALCAMTITKHDPATGRRASEAFAPGHGGGRARVAVRHRADDSDAVCCEGERCARRDGAKVSHQRERYPGEEVFAEQNGVARIGGDAEHI